MDTKAVIGQTPSLMFLWFLVGKYRRQVSDLVGDDQALIRLRIRFRGNTEEVLDAVCAQFQEEDRNPDLPRLLPSHQELRSRDFEEFCRWWFSVRSNCGPSANVGKYRSIALLIPGLQRFFGSVEPSRVQWQLISRFLQGSRQTARDILNVPFPEPKGKWSSQKQQLEAFDHVVEAIRAR